MEQALKPSLVDLISEAMRVHVGEHGTPIGEGGCPRINWYGLRNELAAAIEAWNNSTPTSTEASPVVGEIEVVARALCMRSCGHDPDGPVSYADPGPRWRRFVGSAKDFLQRPEVIAARASLQSENQALREARAAWEETRLANAHLNNEPTDEQVERAKRIIERALLLHISPLVIRAALKAAGPSAQQRVSERVRHKKRGTEYEVIGVGKMQCDWWQIAGDGTRYPTDMREVTIYRSIDDGCLWVRPREEFEDGRFEAALSPENGGA